MYNMPAAEAKDSLYTDKLRGWMVETIVAAIADLKPGVAGRSERGRAAFAVNRREPTSRGIINGYNPKGPVDHDVPVLRVESPSGKLKAVVFGYACHNTTMQFYKWCGDYAGFALVEIERATREQWPCSGSAAAATPTRCRAASWSCAKNTASSWPPPSKKP